MNKLISFLQSYKRLVFFTALAFSASIVWAATTYVRTDEIRSPYPQRFHTGIFLGNEDSGVTGSSANRMTRHIVGSRIYDFPSLTQDLTHMNTICQDSFNVPLPGCRFNDRLSIGVDQVYVSPFISFVPRLTVSGLGGTAVVQECLLGINDGGAADMPDATYTVSCDSNQF